MTPRRLKRRVLLLMDAIEDDYQAGIVRGAATASGPSNVQLVCVAGGVVGDAKVDARSQRNFLFDLADPAGFDGTLALAGALGNQIGVGPFARFIERFAKKPLVNLGVEVPGLHSIAVDGAPGMRDVILHLIHSHERRRIAFVRGPTTSHEAEQRYAAYLAALNSAGLKEDPRLVLQGSWLRDSGALAVRELFDVRGVPVEGVRAIACANDYMALGALDELRERGISVPGDIAVTGFDDVEALRSARPPLTTVAQPTEALGREGLRRLVTLMNRGEEPLLGSLAAPMVVRRSCGCMKVETRARIRTQSESPLSFELAILERRALICAELSRSARGGLFGAGSGWEERLLNALIRDLSGQDSVAFLNALDRIMVNLQQAGAPLDRCPEMLSTLRRAVQDCARSDPEVLAQLDDIIDSARELIAEWLVRNEISRRSEMSAQLRAFAHMTSFLLTGPNPDNVRSAFEERFSKLGIPAISIGLFTEPGKVTPECRSVAAFNGDRRLRVSAKFYANDFAPREAFDGDARTLLVQPLVFEGEPLGILTAVLGNVSGGVYEQMRETLSTGLMGLRLAAQR